MVDDDWGRTFVLLVRGVVAREQGQPERAADLFDQARLRGERTGHPLLLGIAHTLHGFAALASGDAAAAEKDAHAVLDVAGPYGAAEAARMGPRVLLGRARLADGDVAGAVGILGEVATAMLDGEPASVLISPRQAVAEYAAALLAAQRTDEALATARRALQLPGEDVRGRHFADRVLADAAECAGAEGAVNPPRPLFDASVG